MRTLTLKRGEDKRLRAGHLWVFSNEVDVKKTPLTDFAPGEEATVTDHRGAPLGSALVSPNSLICARLHAREKDVPFDAALLEKRLSQALAFREGLIDVPFYRLAYAEGDFLPGLVIDRFGGHLTIQAGTAGLEARKDLIADVLEHLLHPTSILWDNTVGARALEGLSQESTHTGDVPEELEIPENGCLFHAPCLSGQKTGWYYDQRPNRAVMARIARGASVLDACSYVGGFGTVAGKAGATSVTFVDVSAQALTYARGNLERNAPSAACTALEGDVFESLQALKAEGATFGVVSIDPPAFIKRRKDMKEGIAAYRRLNTLAASLVADGGFLVTSSCSQHFPLDDLRRAAAIAAKNCRFHARLIHTGFQGPDHPVHASMPETSYLKCFVVQLTR